MQKATIFVLLAVIAVASATTGIHEKLPQKQEIDPAGDAPESIVLNRISSLGLQGGTINNAKLKSLKKESAPQVQPSIVRSPSTVKKIVSQFESRTDSTGAQRPVSSPKFGRKNKI
uniref:SSGP-11C family protein n=1 Tax=Mayetiola destructor TaxID=39758 RepID=A0PGP0_MAYDE|nr:SSGP-11C family protein [Mayetiola destructor]